MADRFNSILIDTWDGHTAFHVNFNTIDANFTKSSLNGHIATVYEGEKPLNFNTLNRILEKKYFLEVS